MSKSKDVQGRYFHIVLSLIKFRVVVVPLVIVILGEFTHHQRGRNVVLEAEYIIYPYFVITKNVSEIFGKIKAVESNLIDYFQSDRYRLPN